MLCALHFFVCLHICYRMSCMSVLPVKRTNYTYMLKAMNSAVKYIIVLSILSSFSVLLIPDLKVSYEKHK